VRNGGRFIFVEKVIFPDDEAQTLLTKVYHAIKMQNGYTLEQVIAKNESLRNVLVSQTIESNTQMLKAAGFTSVSTFWQNTAFVGWVAS
jgi:tRNA (cmo5U34)-methyltransferase